MSSILTRPSDAALLSLLRSLARKDRKARRSDLVSVESRLPMSVIGLLAGVRRAFEDPQTRERLAMVQDRRPVKNGTVRKPGPDRWIERRYIKTRELLRQLGTDPLAYKTRFERERTDPRALSALGWRRARLKMIALAAVDTPARRGERELVLSERQAKWTRLTARK